MSQRSRVIVTGAAGGLGQALCTTFAHRGYAVLGLDRRALPWTSGAAGPPCEFVSLDCTDDSGVNELLRQTELPEGSVLINNAGVSLYGDFDECSYDDLRTVLDANVVAAFLVTQSFCRRLGSQRGVVVNVLSDLAYRGHASMVAYAMSKHALLGFSRSLMEIAKDGNLECVNVFPGPMSTDILGPGTANPLDMSPSEVAEAIASSVEQRSTLRTTAIHLAPSRYSFPSPP